MGTQSGRTMFPASLFDSPYTLPGFLDTWASCCHSIRRVTGTHTSYRV